MKSGQLLREYRSFHQDFSLRHIGFNTSGQFVVVPQVRNGLDSRALPLPLVADIEGGILKVPEFKLTNKEIQSQCLSVAVHDQHYAFTCPKLNLIHVCSLDQKEILKSFHLEECTGITISLDRKFYLINSFRGHTILAIDTKSLESTILMGENSRFLAGRHLQKI